jgi:hypothetical protein
MFQQRHFEAIAQLMQHTQPVGDGEYDIGRRAHHEFVIYSLVDLFHRTNPRFNEDRFRRACIPGANVRARTR